MFSPRMKKFITISSIILITCLLIIAVSYTLPIIFVFTGFLFALFSPFIIAFFIAFLLSNLVDRLERLHMKRIIAVGIVFAVFFSLLVFAVISLIPFIKEQVANLMSEAPQLLEGLELQLADLWTQFNFVPVEYHYSLKELGNIAGNLIRNNIRVNVSGIFNIFNIIVIIPVITFYFLLDYNKIKERVRKYLRKKKWFYFHRYLHQLEEGMGSYLKGLLLVIHLLVIIATIFFYIIGIDYPLLFGVIIGYTNVIPFLGPYIGGAPAVLYAFTQSPQMAVLVLIIIVVLQAIESMIITPYVQSKSISVHPLYILLALVVFGKLLGIFGMIIAIPLLYFIIITVHYLKVYTRCKRAKKAHQIKMLNTINQ